MDFYKSFKTVIIYAGSKLNYVGKVASIEREKIIQIFNPKLSNSNLKSSPSGIKFYDCGTGARVIISRHFSSGFGHTTAKDLASLIK